MLTPPPPPPPLRPKRVSMLAKHPKPRTSQAAAAESGEPSRPRDGPAAESGEPSKPRNGQAAESGEPTRQRDGQATESGEGEPPVRSKLELLLETRRLMGT